MELLYRYRAAIHRRIPLDTLRARPTAEAQLADAIAAAQLVPSPTHLYGAVVFG